MNAILVPSEGDYDRSLHAVHFALEFAKRTGARVLFLTVNPKFAARTDEHRLDGPVAEVAPDLDRVISNGRVRGLEVETHFTSGDYVGRVASFARDHHVSRVVVALPAPDSTNLDRVEDQVNALRSQLDCVLITVRPRTTRPGEPRRSATSPSAGER